MWIAAIMGFPLLLILFGEGETPFLKAKMSSIENSIVVVTTGVMIIMETDGEETEIRADGMSTVYRGETTGTEDLIEEAIHLRVPTEEEVDLHEEEVDLHMEVEDMTAEVKTVKLIEVIVVQVGTAFFLNEKKQSFL